MTIGERIVGRRVVLAPLRIENAPAWTRWLNDPETTRYLFIAGERPARPFTLAAETAWGRRSLADPARVFFGIEEAASGRVIGHARLTPGRRRRATFGIVIGEARDRGRGLGREATALVCEYGFTHMELAEITLEVDPRNRPAVRAYRAVGFEQRGVRTMALRRAQLTAAAA